MKNSKKKSDIIYILVILLMTAANGFSQSNKENFKGIENSRVLPLLKNLPRQHGGMNVPVSDGRLLYDIVLEKKYKKGLELGTSNGYSALWLGAAFKRNGGKLITLEIERKRAEEAQANFTKAGLEDVIDSRICDAFKEIDKIEGDFDFIFIDAWKDDYLKFFNILKSRVTAGGVITAHNVKNARYEMADFLDAIKSDPSFTTFINKTSSAGVSISYKKK